MKIISIQQLSLPEILLITFARFSDERGYFTETFNIREFQTMKELNSLSNLSIQQSNESFSKKKTIRGLHFQWSPQMGKFVRTVYGHMVDIILDVRTSSKTFGKAIMCDMPANQSSTTSQAIWIPPGFAHGNYYMQDSFIEYFCTSTYSPTGEIGIFPFSNQIDWSLADRDLHKRFTMLQNNPIISKKDLAGIELSEWKNNINSNCFDI